MTTTTDVPSRLPVAINGRAYMADPRIERATIPVIRQQADTSTEAGEQTLNTQGLWRRSQESWHHGAGQTFLDGRQGGEAPDPHRFLNSYGIDPWTKGEISLLPPALRVFKTADTNLYLATVFYSNSFYLLASSGTEVYHNTLPFGGIEGISTFGTQTGTGWTAVNATISVSATNLNLMRLTASASAAVSATSPSATSGAAVNGGRRYGFVVTSLNVSGSGAKTPQVNVNWYDAAGALISSTAPVAASGPDTASVSAYSDATAPATAVYASVTLSYTANWTSGDIHDVVAQIGPYDDLPSAVPYPGYWTSLQINAGQAAQTVQSMTSDGTNLWVALGTSGLHRWSPAGTATADVPAAPAGGQISLAGYANGFLLAAGSTTSTTGKNVLWLVGEPLGVSTLTVIKTHPNTSFEWTGISPGRNCVYAYGNSGGNGEVYKILFDPNTGSLSTAASFATYLPDGETIHALTFYAGGIVMGTGRGVRIGTADGAGNIDYGPLIETDWPVRCLEPQGRYCWFGWKSFGWEEYAPTAINTGLGRIDLGYLTDTLTPAWASDLMAVNANSGDDIVACTTFAPYGYTANQRPPIRVFTVAGRGVYVEDPGSRVLTGWFDTGTIRFSTSEPKTARSVDARHHALPAGGSIDTWISADGGSFQLLGSSTTAGSHGPASPVSAGDRNVEGMRLRFFLQRPSPSGTDYTGSPELTRWTAKALPLPSTIDETFTIPLIMRARTQTGQGDGTPYDIDVATEIAYLKGLERTRTLIDLQIGSETVTECYVVASKFEPDVWSDDRTQLEGIYTIQISTARK